MDARKITGVVLGLLVVSLLLWNGLRHDKLVIESWCQENHLRPGAIEFKWKWDRGPFGRYRRGNVYRFDAARDGDGRVTTYWALVGRAREKLEVDAETAPKTYVPVARVSFPPAWF